MKILLIGEYSGFHNSLKDGFLELGHEVFLSASSDGFKKFQADLLWEPKKDSKLGKIELMFKVYQDTKKFSKFDVVQFINPWLFNHYFGFNKMTIQKLIRNNNKSFLSVAGDDSIVWDYFKNMKTSSTFKYNWVRDIIEQDNPENVIWERKWMREWTNNLTKQVDGIIPIAYEYKMAYSNFKNCKALIKMPVNLNKIIYQENKIKNNKLVIFHGLNRESAKGTMYVRQAFEKLRNKYPNDLELIIEGNLPYHDYLKVIAKTNVVIDQTSSYSLGMNALFSMAMGKVVLGGAEPIAMCAMGYEFCPAINITPDPDDIVNKILKLLDEKKNIEEIGRQSRKFVETYHHYIKIAQQYIETYKG